MAKFPGSGSSRPDPGSSTPDPGSTTTATPDASPPPPPSSAPSGPTGSLGFSMTANSMETLRRQANDLRAAYGDMAGKLSGQRLGATALGMLGMPAVLALNSSNGKSVERAKQAGDTLGQVGDGVKATADTHFSLDRYSGSQFDGIVTDTTARPPAGAPSGGGKPVVPQGPATSQAENVPGDPGAPAPRIPQPQGPPATGVTPVPGDGGTTSAAADTPGAQGPQAQPVPTAPGGRTPGPTTTAAAPGTQLPPIPGFRGDLTAPAAQGAPRRPTRSPGCRRSCRSRPSRTRTPRARPRWSCPSRAARRTRCAATRTASRPGRRTRRPPRPRHALGSPGPRRAG
ncbi:Basic proline-rich protein precursor [Actinosynnema pretiosum subsp. pretiosum]|nr:Basic proline-rich protein precursor [Actinosynnema pretiosum subsp. pretiosum]